MRLELYNYKGKDVHYFKNRINIVLKFQFMKYKGRKNLKKQLTQQRRL